MNDRNPWGRLALLALLLLSPLALARRDEDKKDKDDARLVADSEVNDLAVRHVLARLAANKIEPATFLEESVGFSPTAADFPMEIHAYADLPDAVKFHLALRAREKAQAGSARLVLASWGKLLSLTDKDVPATDRIGGIDGYLMLRKAMDPKYDPKDTATARLKFAYPEKPKRPDLPPEVRTRLGIVSRYLSDPRQGGPTAALQRYFKRGTTQAQEALWRNGSLRLAVEAEVARAADPKEAADKFVEAVAAEAKKKNDPTLERVAALWPDRELKGVDDLPAPGKAVGKRPEPPPAAMKAEARAAEYKKYGDEAGSLKPADVLKRASYPNGIYYSASAKGEDLPTPGVLRFVPDKDDASRGKLLVVFKNMKTKRSLGGVSAEDARAAWGVLFGKDAVKDGDGVAILGLEAGSGGNHFDFTKTEVRRGQRRDVIVHPALLDTEVALAGIRIEALANSRNWLQDQLDADPGLGAKDAKARSTLKTLTDWAFDPWRNLDVFYGGSRQSVFRMIDVPMVVRPGSEDGTLRVVREGEEYDELLRGRAYLEMLLHVQQVKDSGVPKGDAEEVKKFAKESYPIVGDLLRSSPEFARLNNFAAVLALARWAKGKGATFEEPPAPKGGPRTPESVAVFPDVVVPLARMTAEEVRKSEDKRLEAKLDELRKSAGLKKYHKAWAGWFDAAKSMDDLTPFAKAQQKLEETDDDVKMFEKVVRALYVDRVEEVTRKNRAKDGKLNQKKVREGMTDLIEEVKKKMSAKPAESGLALFLLEDMIRRILPMRKDDA